MSTVTIVANGEDRRIAEGTTVGGLLEILRMPAGRVAVEHNGAILPRERYADTLLAAGDRIEVVTLVGGG